MGKKIFIFAVFVAFAACAKLVDVQILHTTDIHSTFVRETEGGSSFLQLATLIDMQRERVGAERTLLIDTGDTCQGSFVASMSKGEAAISVIQAMKYDVWVPGNHEFDFGVPQFWKYVEALRPILLCGNLHPLEESRETFAEWRIFERGGARIAVIGATASYLPQWNLGEFTREFRVELAADMLGRIMKDVLASKPDMIVLAVHQGYTPGVDVRGVNEIQVIAQRYPEIDLILGGHTHFEISGKKMGPNSWLVQPGSGGACFGVVTATVDTDKHQVEEIQSYLQFNTKAELLEYQPARQAVGTWLDDAEQLAGEVICKALEYDISPAGRPGENCSAAELLAKAIMAADSAEIGLHGVLSSKVLAGGKPVTRRDVFQFVPYDNEIVEIWVTPDELAEIAAEQWVNRKHYSYCGIYGAKVKVQGKSDGVAAEVIGIGPDNAPPVAGRRYKMVLNNHTAAGSGRFTRLREIVDSPEAKCRRTGIMVRDAVMQYLSRQ